MLDVKQSQSPFKAREAHDVGGREPPHTYVCGPSLSFMENLQTTFSSLSVEPALQ